MKIYLLFAVVFFGSPTSFAAQAWYVGPSQLITDIQAAVDQAASGDVILVDSSPSPYGPFKIVGKSLSVLSSSGGTYAVMNTPVQPAIEVVGLPSRATVSIYDATVSPLPSSEPAIRVSGNLATVRLNRVTISPQGAWSNGPLGMIEIESSPSVWISQTVVQGGYQGSNSTNGNGIAALRMNRSNLQMQSGSFQGSNLTSGRGGDGFLIESGEAQLWGMVFGVMLIQGGSGQVGGDGIHKLTGFAQGCGAPGIHTVRGVGTVSNGVNFWIPNGSGPGWQAILPACIYEVGIGATWGVDRISINQTLVSNYSASPAEGGLAPGANWLFAGIPTYQRVPSSSNGRFMFDFVIPPLVLGSGYGPMNTPLSSNITVPGLALGMQFAIQGVSEVIGGASPMFVPSEPQMLVVIP